MTDSLATPELLGPSRRVPGISDALGRRRRRPHGRVYAAARWGALVLFCALAGAIVVSIATDSSQAIAHSGISFFWSGTWNPAKGQYGAGILIVGTLITTAVAMLIVVPVGIGVALYLSEMSPRWLSGPVSAVIDLLAAVPSIIVGLWGLIVLSPVFAQHVEPFLKGLPLVGKLFTGPSYGPSILLASVVLAVMTLPTVTALSRSALLGVDVADREAAMALGATRWQVVSRAVIPGASSGIRSAVVLAIGRAFGESIAVALVIGNRPAIPHSLSAPGATLGSAIVNQFAEATPGLGTSSVVGLALVLLILTVLVNAGGRALVGRNIGTRRRPAGAPA